MEGREAHIDADSVVMVLTCAQKEPDISFVGREDERRNRGGSLSMYERVKADAAGTVDGDDVRLEDIENVHEIEETGDAGTP